MYRHICSYCFQQTEKHTHTLNKIVGIKATKRQCQKTSNLGGLKVVPTQKFWPRIVYNDKFLTSQLEMDASKNTALKWFAYNKAFQKIDEKKSYAQALGNTVTNKDHKVKVVGIVSRDVIQETSQCIAKVCKRDVKSFSPTDTSLSITNTVQCLHPDPCYNKKSQTNTAEADSRKSVGVTVTGASPCRSSVLVKNRFQPLQMLLVDDHIDDRSEQVLQGQKSDRYSLTKAVNVKNVQPNIKPLLSVQENKLLVGKNKTGSLARGRSEGCHSKNHSKSTNVCQATPAGELSMHKTIDKQMLSRNLEPPYIDPIIETCLSNENEVIAHTDMKPDNSKFVANTFGFIPKAPLQVYTGEVV